MCKQNISGFKLIRRKIICQFDFLDKRVCHPFSYIDVTDSRATCIHLVLSACDGDGGAKVPQERLGGMCVSVCMCVLNGTECVLSRG